MNELRKLHNNCKRDLIKQWVPPGSHVLDCGCGRGGDLQKWKLVNARVDAIDPDEESITEARRRAKDMNLNIYFLGIGDIRNVSGQWDVVCYNFSLHYIFENEKILNESIEAIVRAVKPGGLLIGIAPEKIRIETMCEPSGIFKDSLGNIIENFPHHASIKLMDGPFYDGESKNEPLMDGELLILKLKNSKFQIISWEPMIMKPNGLISDMYTKFVFRNNRNVEGNPIDDCVVHNSYALHR
jgi:ubiquinone/menaquinone biosynthesis C-methylase UbiE